MALGAVLAAALTDHGPRSKGLYLDGLDVALEPGAPGNRAGVPIETVRMTEAGPGAISAMEFTIEDPLLGVTVAEGMEVRFHDLVRDVPLFTGYVQNFSVRPELGVGRTIDVTCIGVEAILDWATLPADVTFNANYLNNAVNLPRAVQALVAVATGAGALRAFTAVGVASSQETPIWGAAMPGATFTDALTIPAGTSLREAIRRMGVNRYIGTFSTSGNGDLYVTVDFTYGLRTWPVDPDDPATWLPSDYATLTVDDDPASSTVAEDLKYTVDAAGVVRTVVVRGTGITETVTDGTGLPGPTAVLDDATVTTVAQAEQAGLAYLASFATGLRGSYRLTDREPIAGVHAGSPTVMTDDQVGLAASVSRIAQIEKTFTGSNREDWTIAFGGLPPSGAALIRRLTRDTLS